MAEVYEEGSLSFARYPFPRSIQNIVKGKKDFHMPLLKNPLLPEDSLPFRYSTASFAEVTFVIYSHKKNPISRHDLNKVTYKLQQRHLKLLDFSKEETNKMTAVLGKTFKRWNAFKASYYGALGVSEQGQSKDLTRYTANLQRLSYQMFPYRIGTEPNHTVFFDFPTIKRPNLTTSLKSVNMGRLDGYILAQEECDAVVRSKKLHNIYREKYDIFEAKFVLHKGPEFEKIDRKISKIISTLKNTGRFKSLSFAIHRPFDPWIP